MGDPVGTWALRIMMYSSKLSDHKDLNKLRAAMCYPYYYAFFGKPNQKVKLLNSETLAIDFQPEKCPIYFAYGAD